LRGEPVFKPGYELANGLGLVTCRWERGMELEFPLHLLFVT
jgi:hypothetical protein